MALPRDYPDENCPIARSLEVVGERWTLLIVRDAFYGVRRFTDFQVHLDIPKAVLSQRLTLLVQEGILRIAAAVSGGRDEYVLTSKGRRLWPVLRALTHWGAEHYQTPSSGGPSPTRNVADRSTRKECAAGAAKPLSRQT